MLESHNCGCDSLFLGLGLGPQLIVLKGVLLRPDTAPGGCGTFLCPLVDLVAPSISISNRSDAPPIYYEYFKSRGSSAKKSASPRGPTIGQLFKGE